MSVLYLSVSGAVDNLFRQQRSSPVLAVKKRESNKITLATLLVTCYVVAITKGFQVNIAKKCARIENLHPRKGHNIIGVCFECITNVHVYSIRDLFSCENFALGSNYFTR